MKWLALLAFSFTVAHAGFHLRQGRPGDVLWICTLSPAIIGTGLLLGQSTLVAVGVLTLLLGLPLWTLDVWTGREFHPTSVLTHWGGLIVGLVGLC